MTHFSMMNINGKKDNQIKITEKYRAEKIHKVLYQCPSCLTEHEMDSKGHTITVTIVKKHMIWMNMENYML